MNEQDTEALLTTPVDTFASSRTIAIRARHWAHSGIVNPGQRWTVEAGRRVELICLLSSTTRRFELVRRPSASTAILDGNRLTPDVGGLYVVTIEIAGWVRTIEMIAAPEALLDQIGPRAATFDRLIVLRSVVNDPACTADTIVSSLEDGNPTFGLDGALHGHDCGISLKNYGR